MGGFWPIGIQSIRIIDTAKNYETVLKALCSLDAILSPGMLGSIVFDCNVKEVAVLTHLIEDYNVNKDKTMDDYIYNIFDSFVKNKHEIYVNTFNVQLLQGIVPGITSLIWHEMKRNYDKTEKDDKTNLMKSTLLQSFKYTKKLTVEYASPAYQISLWSLLSLIKDTSLEEIILFRAFKNYIISSDLEEKYEQAGYRIYKDKNIDYGEYAGNINISKSK